jgi:S-DNA-T family DNA segregation ATPase FtsK/SpoIIIE
MAKKSKNNTGTDNSSKAGKLKDRRLHIMLGLFFIGLSAIILLSFVSFLFSWRTDSMLMDASVWDLLTDPDIKPSNWMGKVGVAFSVIFILRWVGIPAFLVIPVFFLVGMRFLGKRVLPFRATTIRLVVVMFWLSISFGYLFYDRYFLIGGAHGHYISNWLQSMLGTVGTGFFMLFVAIGILAFLFEPVFSKMVEFIRQWVHEINERRRIAAERAASEAMNKPVELSDEIENTEIPEFSDSLGVEPYQKVTNDPYNFIVETTMGDEEEFTNDLDETETEILPNPINPDDATDNLLEIELLENEGNVDFETDSLENGTNDVQPKVERSPKKEGIGFEIKQGIEEEEAEENLNTVAEGKFDPKLDLSNYQYPTLALLPKLEQNASSVSETELQVNKDKIVETLANYGIKIDTIKATIGPTVTLYEIVPAPGIRISKIKSLENDIALSLAALGIRIIAPMPGKGTIGIEVPNQNPEVVTMRSVLGSKKFQDAKFELPLALGKTITNETFIIDLVKAPHLLVAGATGQGKSVGLNAILTSLLYKKHPAELKLVLIDPKKVELTLYNKLEKHFLASLPDTEEPIITDTTKVINTLNSLCLEMDSRYDLLKMAQVRNIKEYNEKFINRQLNPLKGHRYMPYIVVVIDEYADLIMTAGKEIEMPIARIAQLARAIGIHLIIATQRPTTNIITGLIKANFPARIAFRVTSGIDSKTILDGPGANQLIGRGDMLVSLGSEPVRVQCAFLDTPEVDMITDYISKQQSYPSVFELPEYAPEGGGLDSSSVDLSQKDSLFEEAARLLVIHQQGSTSLIQRKFSIGYNRAGRIVDQLEVAGVVGPFEGSKARQVLIPDEYALELLLKNLR